MISGRIFGTPVKVKFSVLPIIIILWGGLTWLGLYWHPERGFWRDLLIGFVTAIVLLVVEFGHPFAHIFSARYAKAPIDEILISGDMPRTLYWNNDVSPNAHRLRAMGGPIYNILGLLLSLGVYVVMPDNSLARELAAWSAGGHGLLFLMSMMPLPMVDGGAILKWTLVAKGRTEIEADEIIRRVDWVMGIVGGIIGIGLIIMKMWIPGVVLMGIGAFVIGIAAGKI
jgi:hypothetical protein